MKHQSMSEHLIVFFTFEEPFDFHPTKAMNEYAFNLARRYSVQNEPDFLRKCEV
jgi:hypothetical protein